jgi:MFS family permease
MGVLGAKFGPLGYDVSQLMAIPSIPIIIVTIVAGKLQEYIPIKVLVVVGILCFIVGGIVPAFLSSFSAILVLRVIFGIGVGLAQTLSSALVGMHFEGAERQKVMGIQTSAQMIGAAVMMFASGYLAKIRWEATFWVHTLAILSLIVVLVCLPMDKPMRKSGGHGSSEKVKLTGSAIGWALTLTIFFLAGMILAQFIALFMQEHGIGGAPESGNATLLFAIGGFVTGLIYGKLNSVLKNFTLTVGCLLGIIAFLLIAFAKGVGMAYVGSFIYGGCISVVMASVMTATAMSVKPNAIPLAIALTTCGQNLGSYFCPIIARWGAGLFGSDITKNVFLFGCLIFAIIGIIYVFWGIAETKRQKNQ